MPVNTAVMPLPNRPMRLLLATLAALAVALPVTAGNTVPASAASFDPASAEQQMANLVNQDRAQNGLGPLTLSTKLSGIARGSNVSLCGTTVHGRSQDMAERNYFSHQVPPCGGYVWPGLQAAGISFSGVAENIGWNNYSPQASSVDGANTSFMNSSGHRANILGNYNQVGIGAYMAPGPWNGGSGNLFSGVILYTEIFVNGPTIDAAPPPPPPPGASTAPVGVVGADGALWISKAGVWSSLGGGTTGAPATINTGTDHVYVIIGNDRDLWIRGDYAGWHRLSTSKVICLDSPASAVVPDGAGGTKLMVACEGADRALWVADTAVGPTGSMTVSNWKSLGGVLGYGPAVAMVDGQPTVYVVGIDGKLYTRTSSGWGSTTWSCIGHPAAISAGSTSYLACQGVDHQLWWARHDGTGWTPARGAGGAFVDGVGAAPTQNGVTFLGQGLDGAVWEMNVLSGGLSGWGCLGGMVHHGVGSSQ